jgi:DNA-binding cell septation regulator SpoVG
MIEVNNLFTVKAHKTVKANGYLTIDGKWKVKFLLLEGKKGLFVSFPSDKFERKQEDGTTKTDYARHFEPVTKEAIAELNQAVITAFVKKTGMQQPSAPEPEVQQFANDNLVPF